MPTIYDFKPRFQGLLRPVVGKLALARVTPNRITLLALLLSLGTGALLLTFPMQRWVLALVPIALLLRMSLNAMDGMLAREHGMRTQLGALLNELGDVISDAALYLPFAVVPGGHGGAVAVFAVLAVISEMAGTVAVQIGASRRYDGPLGKSDRAFAVGAIALLLALGVTPGGWLTVAWTILCVLAVVTVINRARQALREVSG